MILEMVTDTLPALFRILSDGTRLRALGLLAREELAVGEMARVLSLSTSRLSNHLRILREANLVLDRKEGTWTFVRLNPEGFPPALWSAVEDELSKSGTFEEDLASLRDVLEERRARSRSYFDQIAPHWDIIGSDFRAGSARYRVASRLLPRTLTIADVGCGTGYLAAAIAPLARRLILIDHSPAMLAKAKANLAEFAGHLDYRQGEMDVLPLEDQEVDALVAGLVAHHAPDLSAFLREAHRALKPGGILVLEDLLPHREGWMRESMADLRLGIDPRDLERRLVEVGFENPHTEHLEDAYTPERPEGGRVELPLFLTRARKRAET